MAKHLIKQITPDHETIRNHKRLKVFGRLLHDANLWHLNRRSAAGAFAIGLFVAFIPVPFQMLLAAAVAIAVRVNLPLSVALVWVSNPVTIPPMFYFAYIVGTAFIGQPAQTMEFELSGNWLMGSLGEIWAPLLLGCFVCGSVCAATGYLAIRALWRWHVIQHMKRRRSRAQAGTATAPRVPQ
jgi:uncharacterized protein (DUF2062 family)